jgi:hypothetical protein
MNRRTFLKAIPLASVALAACARGAEEPAQRTTWELNPVTERELLLAGHTGTLRTIEVYDRGVWRQGAWAQLKRDDVFRVREPDGQLVNEGEELEICIATDAAFPDPKAGFGVQCEPFVHIAVGHAVAPRIDVHKDNRVLGRVKAINLRNRTMVYVTTHPGADQPVVEHQGTFDYITIRS